MGRPLRVDVGGYVYHALNRASAGATMFDSPIDYGQFERVLEDARCALGCGIAFSMTSYRRLWKKFLCCATMFGVHRLPNDYASRHAERARAWMAMQLCIRQDTAGQVAVRVQEI